MVPLEACIGWKAWPDGIRKSDSNKQNAATIAMVPALVLLSGMIVIDNYYYLW